MEIGEVLASREPTGMEDPGVGGISEKGEYDLSQMEREAFFEQNPVMMALRAEQERQGLPPDTMPVMPEGQIEHPLLMRTIEEAEVSDQISNQVAAMDKTGVPMNPNDAVGISSLRKQTSNEFDKLQQKILTAEKLGNQGFMNQRKGQDMVSAAEAAQADVQADMEQVKADSVKAINDKRLEGENKRIAELEGVLGKQREAMDFINKSAINPDRWWNSRTTGQKISLGIGAALAGIGGGSNAVLNMVNNAIENDISAQEKMFEMRGSQVKNYVSLANDLFKNKGAALDMARVFALENLNNMITARVSKTKSPIIRANALKAKGMIKQKQAEFQMSAAEKMASMKEKSGKEDKLGAEEKKRLDNVRESLQAIDGMFVALQQGQNTFSMVGDNDFTFNRNLFVEALGRMQSGGAITKDELETFRNLVPTAFDSEKMQQKKLRDMRVKMINRLKTLGKEDQAKSGYEFRRE